MIQIKSLRWYEWVMVTSTLVPGVVTFKIYVKTLFLIIF
jgi:hypothetical protein